jgi:hypothetical protein
MKIKTFYIPLFILVIDLLLSLPQFNFKVIGALRILFVPILILTFVDSLGKVNIKRFKFTIRKSLPWLIILMLFVLQIFAIPEAAVSIHLSGCIKFISWTLLYLCSLISMNAQNALKFRKIITGLLLFIFLATIIQYPILIQRSSVSLGALITSYGQQENKDVFGLFASANEDANSLIALFPFALLYVERNSGIKRLILRILIFLYIPIVLFFNGTRTALFITFPLITLLFYLRLSLKTLLRTTPFLLAGAFFFNLYIAKFAQSSFSRESQGGGTLGFRVERAWIPASNYTYEHSPIWGFGSRGWEYVGDLLQIVRGAGEANAFEVIPPHNVYVWTYVSWGAVGLICYLLVLIFLLKDAFQLSTFPNPEIAGLGKALFCSTFAYCIWAGISNAQIESGWLVLLSIAILTASLQVSASFIRSENYSSVNNLPSQRIVSA